MPQFSNIKAWIEVEGVALDEFKVEINEEERTVECHVPSESGKEFSVRWSWQRDCDSSGQLTVDGQERSRCKSGAQEKKRCRIDTMTIPDDPRHTAKLKFGDIRFTDDECFAMRDEHQVKALGSIKLEVWMGRKGRQMPLRIPKPRISTRPAIPQPQPVYERMKKAGCHQVVLGEVVSRAATKEFFRDNGGSVRFIFLYRSKDILLAQGIIPPPVATSGKGNSRKSARNVIKHEQEDVPEDEEEDERNLRALEEQAAAIKERMKKRKISGGDRSALKKLKVEEIDARTAFRPGEIIDLCDD